MKINNITLRVCFGLAVLKAKAQAVLYKNDSDSTNDLLHTAK